MAKRGAMREYQVRDLLRERGWWAKRMGEATPFDVLALRPGSPPQFVEVKANRAGGPYMNFRPVDRERLRQDAALAGAEAALAYWPPHRELVWIAADDWPVVEAVR